MKSTAGAIRQRGEKASPLRQVPEPLALDSPSGRDRCHRSAENVTRIERIDTMAGIELEQLTKVYADGTRAVTELDLDVEDGEFVVFVGPSGCGKTTALRMIAGLEDITAGTVRRRRARS